MPPAGARQDELELEQHRHTSSSSSSSANSSTESFQRQQFGSEVATGQDFPPRPSSDVGRRRRNEGNADTSTPTPRRPLQHNHHHHHRRLLKECTTLALLGTFSFLGLLARLGLIAINTYDGQVVFPILWAQVAGTALMGALASRKEIVDALPLPLYVGLTTGLCGSITSFSSWMLGVFQGFANIDGGNHGGFYNFMDGLSQSVITLAASVAAFILGMHLADLAVQLELHERLRPSSQRPPLETSKRPGANSKPESSAVGNDANDQSQSSAHNNAERVESTRQQHPQAQAQARTRPSPEIPLGLQIVAILLFLLLWLAACLVCYYVPRWRGIVMFGLILSPPGVWLRFYLSRLNPRLARFPLGTFTANLIGTIVLATCVALQRAGPGGVGLSRLQCQVLQGFDDGFCGCLTTVSTFIVEVRKLDRRASYRYALVSWVVGQCIMLAILGSVDFARGGLDPRCAL